MVEKGVVVEEVRTYGGGGGGGGQRSRKGDARWGGGCVEKSGEGVDVFAAAASAAGGGVEATGVAGIHRKCFCRRLLHILPLFVKINK